MKMFGRILKISASVAFFLLLTTAAWAQGSAPPSGASTGQKQPHVYTNEDISGASDQSAAPADQSSKPADQSGQSASGGDASGGDQGQDPKAALAELKRDEKGTKDVIAVLQGKIENETDPTRRQNFQSALEHTRQHLQELEKQIPAAEKAAADADQNQGDAAQGDQSGSQPQGQASEEKPQASDQSQAQSSEQKPASSDSSEPPK